MKKLLLVFITLFLFFNGCSKKMNFTCGISEISQIGMNHIQPVIDAMEKFKNDTGKYPKNALDLIPKYIDQVPIIVHKPETLDNANEYNVLVKDDLRGGVPWIPENRDYFEIEFYSIDNRTCFIGGRNNICKYRSEKKQWSCYQ